ncbi:MAG: hypothetical protein SNJ78_08160, partial [Spirochaetales bacterium]
MLTKKKKERIVLFTVSFFLIVTFLFIYPLHKWIQTYGAEAKERILSYLENLWDIEIRYSSISPSFFPSLEVYQLVLQDRKDPAVFVKAAKFKVHYNLFKLLVGDWGQGIQEIEIENAKIEVNEISFNYFRRKTLPELAGANKVGKAVIPYPRIKGKGITFVYKSPGGTLWIRDSYFSLDQDKDTAGVYTFNLSSRISLSDLPWESLPWVETRIDLTSRFENLGGQTTSTLVIERTETPNFLLDRQTFQISTTENQIVLKRLQDRYPVDFWLQYQPKENRVSGSLVCETFTPLSMFQPLNPSIPLEVLTSSYSGHLDFKYDFALEDITYAGTLEVSLPKELLGLPTNILATFTGNKEELRLSRLQMSNAKGKITYKGKVSVKDYAPEGEVEIDNLTYFSPYPINGTAKIRTTSQGIFLEGPWMSWGNVHLYHYHFDLSLQKPFWEGINRFEGSFSFDPALPPLQVYSIVPQKDRQDWMGGIVLEDFPLSAILPLIKQLQLEEVLETKDLFLKAVVTAQLYYHVSSEGFSLDAPFFHIQNKSAPYQSVQGSFRYNTDHS